MYSKVIVLISLFLYLTPSQQSKAYTSKKAQDKRSFVECIRLLSPSVGCDVCGKTEVRFKAEGMTTAQALCWNAPNRKNRSPWGHDTNLAPEGIHIDDTGVGKFIFNADKLPHGPLNIRIHAQNAEGKHDVFELQVYNKKGKRWNEGIPSSPPPGAKGMKLIFSDDFDNKELSISNDGRGTRYNAHKPTFGDFSGWPFTDVTSLLNPFSQRDTYLKIAARKPTGTQGSSGLLAPVDMDGKGLWVNAPCYFECRFLAQSAPGTWPAFWVLNQTKNLPGDELDIIEAYGGQGEGNPNDTGYFVTAHYWQQKDSEGKEIKAPWKHIDMLEIGSKTSWSTTFHTYGLYVGKDSTVYYLDNIEVFKHDTNRFSGELPLFFLVNYAIGGASGWKINLERYNNSSDMYVDFIRVYQGK